MQHFSVILLKIIHFTDQRHEVVEYFEHFIVAATGFGLRFPTITNKANGAIFEMRSMSEVLRDTFLGARVLDCLEC